MTESETIPNEARIVVRKGALAEAVLARIVGMLAARAHCPIDRLDDALLVSDAVAAHAPDHTADGRLVVSVATDANALTLRVGPLHADGAAAVVADAAMPGVGNVLEHVADELATEPGDEGEDLRIVIAFHRDGADATAS